MPKNVILVACALLSLGSFAHASQSYTALASGEQAAICPQQISDLSVSTKKDSLEVSALKMTLADGTILSGKGSTHRDNCQSDIICAGQDSVTVKNASSAKTGLAFDASVEHNRSQDYPPVYTAGFQTLELMIFDKDFKVVGDCWYGLKTR